MRRFLFSPFPHWLAVLAFFFLAGGLTHAAAFAYGDPVRLTRSETLLFEGKNFLAAPKGQQFTVLKDEARQNLVYVGFYKEDGTLIAVTLPADALEAAPADGWSELLRGAEALRGGRLDEARRALLAAGQDVQYKTIAASLSARVVGLMAASQQGAAGRAALANVAASLRVLAGQLAGQGFYSLAWSAEEGADRFGPLATPPAPTGNLDREELKKRAMESGLDTVRARQAMALHRMVEASKYVEAGLAAEPARPDLLAFQTKVKRDLADAEENYVNAERMRRFVDGTPHALTALEHGLKSCIDYPKLRQLKAEMQGAVEQNTAPKLTPALLTAAKVPTPMVAAEEGRQLYTSRCTECHDLELLDSRSLSGWEKMVGSMGGRAHLSDAQKARIMDYLTVAWNGAGNSK